MKWNVKVMSQPSERAVSGHRYLTGQECDKVVVSAALLYPKHVGCQRERLFNKPRLIRNAARKRNEVVTVEFGIGLEIRFVIRDRYVIQKLSTSQVVGKRPLFPFTKTPNVV